MTSPNPSRAELREASARRRDYARDLALWTRRGFTIQEAGFLIGNGFKNSKARRGSRQGQFIVSIIERRRLLIQRLRTLGFTERDIFNYLTELVNERNEGAEILLEIFSDLNAVTPDELADFINEDANRDVREHRDLAIQNDWAVDQLERLNWNNQWKRYRFRNFDENRAAEENESGFNRSR